MASVIFSPFVKQMINAGHYFASESHGSTSSKTCGVDGYS